MRLVWIGTLSLLSLQGLLGFAVAQKNGGAEVLLSVYDATSSDTFELSLWNDLLTDESKRLISPLKIRSVKGADGYIHFTIPAFNSLSYFSIGNTINRSSFNGEQLYLFNMYPIEPSDRIYIMLKKNTSADTMPPVYRHPDLETYAMNARYSFGFGGKGYEKMKCRYEMDSVSSRPLGRGVILDYGPEKGSFNPNNVYEQQMQASLKILSQYKNHISRSVSDILYADIIGAYQWEKIMQMKVAKDYGDSTFNRQLIDVYYSKVKPVLKTDVTANAIIKSRFYCSFYIKWKSFESQLDNRTPEYIYREIKNKFQGTVREKMITTYVFHDLKRLPEATASNILQDARQWVNNYFYRQLLIKVADLYAAGKPAPVFSLPDVNGAQVNLRDFLGKVVFIDFWYTGCSNCSAYYGYQLSKVEHHFKDDKRVVFLTISVDGDRDKWLKSVNSGLYTSKNAINLYTNGQTMQHHVIKDYMVEGYPRPVLIDKKGNMFSSSAKDLRKAETLQETISKALAQN
ncbi:MAG: TlpA family protein disulfide reductase [Chitinophagaceae bacterium]|nr:TlpA family protein disulfide reductase [Chitinophagaceae bacterium]